MSRLGTFDPFSALFYDRELTLVSGGGHGPPGDTGLEENPDGTVSGGSVDYNYVLGSALTETFGSASDIDARDLTSTYTSQVGDDFIDVTFFYGPNNEAQLAFDAVAKDDGTLWLDVDGDGTYESHLAQLPDGIYVDTNFDGIFETKFVDFFF